MALCVVRRVMMTIPSRTSINRMLPRFSSLYTPDYLELMKPKFPQYPVINVQIKGYDYPILENFQQLISKLANQLDIDVDNSYALPAKTHKIQRYKPKSSTIDVEYKLNVYERNIQLSNLSSLRFPIFLRIIEAALPEGVMLKIKEWNPEEEKHRYIPDKQLINLKTELESMQKK